MKLTIHLHDDTYAWLAGIKGIGSPEKFIASRLSEIFRSLMFQQPDGKLAPVLDAVTAMCMPEVSKQE